jgi:hypothetical protein
MHSLSSTIAAASRCTNTRAPLWIRVLAYIMFTVIQHPA